MANANDDHSGFTPALEAGKKLATQATDIITLQEPALVGARSVPVAVVPEGMSYADLSQFLLNPQQIRAQAKFPDQASFVAYVNRFKNPDTLIFADLDGLCLAAELDYHGPKTPRARHHSARLQLKKSKEWERWITLDRKPVTQTTLWEFLNDNRRDILSPASADVMEAIRNLKLTQTVVFERAENQRTGEVQFLYQKSVEDRTKGQFTIPTAFTIGLRPFTCSEVVPVQLELRHRVEDDKVTFGLRFDRPDLILEDAFKATLAAVGEAVGIEPLIGQSVAG